MTLMKPGPATEVEANKTFLLFTASTIASASARGLENVASPFFLSSANNCAKLLHCRRDLG